jgi:hypothetical protein
MAAATQAACCAARTACCVPLPAVMCSQGCALQWAVSAVGTPVHAPPSAHAACRGSPAAPNHPCMRTDAVVRLGGAWGLFAPLLLLLLSVHGHASVLLGRLVPGAAAPLPLLGPVCACAQSTAGPPALVAHYLCLTPTRPAPRAHEECVGAVGRQGMVPAPAGLVLRSCRCVQRPSSMGRCCVCLTLLQQSSRCSRSVSLCCPLAGRSFANPRGRLAATRHVWGVRVAMQAVCVQRGALGGCVPV